MTSNTQLQQQVLDELHYEPSVDASEIGVTANDGIVVPRAPRRNSQLTGKVKSYVSTVSEQSRTRWRWTCPHSIGATIRTSPVQPSTLFTGTCLCRTMLSE